MNHLFGSAYRGADVLVTGHTGFKGSWLCLWLQSLGANVTGIALAPDTNPAHWSMLRLDGVQDVHADLRDRDRVRESIEHARPRIVFHLAAQSLVRRSYADPSATFATNVTGLVNLFEAIRVAPSVQAVVNATTDKVYLEHATASGYVENDPLGGHDPYSTSKACAELISECYRKSFFRGADGSCVRIATARAGNVIGGGDWADDRLVPDLVRAASTRSALQIRNPHAVRPWQHVLEPLAGYLRLGQALLQGDSAEGAWNFGPAPDSTLSVSDLVSRMQHLWPELSTSSAGGAHPHEAARLVLDSSKAARELGWQPVWNADTAIARTLAWYRAFLGGGHLRSGDDLLRYVDDATSAGLGWTRGRQP